MAGCARNDNRVGFRRRQGYGGQEESTLQLDSRFGSTMLTTGRGNDKSYLTLG